jgi:hypothetical protein
MWKIEHVTLLSFCFMLTDGFSVVGGGIRSTRMLFTGTKEIIRSQHNEVASIRKKAFSKTALKDKWDDLVDEDEMEDPLWRVGTRNYTMFRFKSLFFKEVLIVIVSISFSSGISFKGSTNSEGYALYRI